MEYGPAVLALLIGVSAGLRSFTPLAVISLALCLERLHVTGLLANLGSIPAAVILSVFAIGELIADKTAAIPNRTSALPFIGRLFSGGLAGYTLALASNATGVASLIFGVVGAGIGTFGGFAVRRYLTKSLGAPDLPVALAEDLIAISLAVATCLLAG
jgi:uncharacterized membrane protein